MAHPENDSRTPHPEQEEPIPDWEIERIRSEPVSTDELFTDASSATPDLNIDTTSPRWHNTSGRTEEEIRELADETDSGSLTLSPCVHTGSYIEFRLTPPTSAATKCTCNECWNTFYIGPFSEPAECPYCHTRGFNIAERRYLPSNTSTEREQSSP